MGILKNFYNYYFSNIYDLKFFWDKNKNHKNIPNDLKKIFDAFLVSDSYQYCSNYWKYLNIKNLKQIMYEGGILNYANSIALNYFTYLDTPLDMQRKLLNLIADTNIKTFLI